jgi:DNA helicase II / ATP-dependent DNA helicase PcrA
VIVGPGGDPPSEWHEADRLAVDGTTLAAPVKAVGRLREAAHTGTSLVIELSVPFDELPGQVERRPTYEIGVAHEFTLDELHHLVSSNAIDVRDPATPRWALLDRAVTTGATIGGAGDVVLADGTEVWLDGGPVRYVEPVDGIPVLHAAAVEHGSLTPPATNDTSADLAPDQLAAVTHVTGTARIIAPAGSGKTRVLTERARHLINAWRLPPAAVCLVAFNKRAQEEMRQRTADLPGLQVRTLNSIALAIINGTPPFASQPRRWTTIDEPAVRRILDRFVARPKRRNTDPLAPWIEALSLVRLGLTTPADAEAAYGGDVTGFTEVFGRYQAALDADGVVDFDGQIDRALAMLLADPDTRRAAQRACRLLLVDEFQDLTPAHLMLVRLLAGPAGSVFGVGDDDQTIYGYNGADPGWLIDFATWFPGAGAHPLEVNYRCPAGVVEVADRLVRHNGRRVAKTIRAASDRPGGWRIADGHDEVAATVEAVTTELASGRAPADIAVLTRVNAVLAAAMIGLIDAGVPVSGGVGAEFVERTAVRAALAWLRLATARSLAKDDLAEAMRRPSRSVHPRIAEWVTEQRNADGLYRLAGRLNNEKDAAKLKEFAGDIARLRALADQASPTAVLVATLIDEIGLGASVSTLDANRQGMNRGSQSDDLLAVRQLARLQPDPTRFDAWLRDRLMTRRAPDGVTLATVHRVKGQEWPCVIVHQASEDQFPHRLAEDHEEERRVFHVAITRAADALTIVPGARPSPFVTELTMEPPEFVELPQAPPAVARSRPAAPPKKDRSADHPLLDRSRVMAVVGAVLVDQDREWTIVELEPGAAVTTCGDATRRFPIGATVETRGRQRGKLGARPGDIDPASVLAYDELRRLRDRVRDGKPAYVVFDDKTLAAIAQHLPADLDELARIRGVGPAKLEQYGDDVLAVVRSVTDQ